MEIYNKSFHERLNLIRKKRKIDIAKLAEATGVSNRSVQNWLTGKSKPDVDKLIPLCRALDVDPGFLLGIAPPISFPDMFEEEINIFIKNVVTKIPYSISVLRTISEIPFENYIRHGVTSKMIEKVALELNIPVTLVIFCSDTNRSIFLSNLKDICNCYKEIAGKEPPNFILKLLNEIEDKFDQYNLNNWPISDKMLYAFLSETIYSIDPYTSSDKIDYVRKICMLLENIKIVCFKNNNKK